MQRLKSREKQIPNGFWFRMPAISWDSRKVLGLHPSFDTLVRAVQSARKANPAHTTKNKWSLDKEAIANEVEQFQVKVCLAAGWTQYLTEGGGGTPPFSHSQSLANQKQLGAAVEKVKKLWAGVKTLNEWLDSGEPPVEPELSEKRAATCIACPLNGQGDFTSWFTRPAADVIAKQIARLTERKISGSLDSKLGVCAACLCPNVLKTKTPMKFIKPHLSQEVISDLRGGKDCWIIAELGV